MYFGYEIGRFLISVHFTFVFEQNDSEILLVPMFLVLAILGFGTCYLNFSIVLLENEGKMDRYQKSANFISKVHLNTWYLWGSDSGAPIEPDGPLKYGDWVVFFDSEFK